MMNLRRSAFILSLLFITASSALAQTDSVALKTIADKAAEFNAQHPVEKVYLHFDKPYYAVGDTIWLKAYLTLDGNQPHAPSTVSNVIYVDVISNKDSIVQKLKLPATGGVAFGNLALTKAAFRQGSYHFRAYTNWMRNFDPTYFFNKTVTIGDAINKTILTNFSLSGSTSNNTAKVNARIVYRNAAGMPIGDKKVTWRVQTNSDETLAKGKGSTDNNGNISISFTTNKTDELNSSTLYAEIDVEPKEVTTSFRLKNATAPMDVQFFPEGGDLINGIKSKVAIKAIQPSGLGIDVKGSVTDNSGAVVTSFITQHLGMGVFDLLPAAGKTYKATVTFPDGSTNSYDLPKAKQDGITLSITSVTPDKISFNILASESYLQANKGKRFYIVAQSGQVICYAAQTASLSTAVYPISIPNKMPSGVGKISLLATNGMALAERLVFSQHNDQLNLTLSTAKPLYTARQQVTMNVSAKNAALPSEANLSVAVIDESKVPLDENIETTILTSLLLTSNLKGYVEKPNYYFNKITDKTNADLDVLMLTQGYRRIVYTDILANRVPAIKFLPEDGITISGTLRNSMGTPISRGSVYFEIKDRRISKNVVTNPVGEFRFSQLYFPDSLQANVNAKGNYNSNNMMIMLDNDSYQPPSRNITAPDAITNIDSTLSTYLQNSKKQNENLHVLAEVVIKATVETKKPSHLDFPSLMGLSNISDQTIPNSYFAACQNMFDCLKGKINSMVFDEENLYIRRDYVQGNKTPVAVYLNGMMVDYNALRGVSPNDVESVEVFVNDGVSGLNRMTGTSGVIVINSKKVDKPKITKSQLDALREELAPANSAVKFVPKGFSMARAFYSPRYEVSKNAPVGGDLRSTIYWNPKIITDKTTGTATFDFFNADGRGTYRAVVEGMDANGNIGRAVYRYKVE